MDKYPPTAWLRLGKDLERRRGQLGYGYRQRGQFAHDKGGKVSGKTLQRLENGDRTAYPESTIGTVEAIYELVPGSVERHLQGGELEPLEDKPGDGYTVTGLTQDEAARVTVFIQGLRAAREEITRSQPAQAARAVAVLASGTAR